LITHGPPFGILDELDNKQHIGCIKLANRIRNLKLKYHVFGLVHNDYGIVRTKKTIFMNSASLDEKYRFINAPLIINHIQS
jgi:Icc-related predicted phosphoesterase